MKTIHILNPAAGQGEALSYKNLENAYVTKCPGDACEFIQEQLRCATENINFKVYGGDGSINEAVTGIVRADSDKAYLSVVAVGTGNDLVRSINKEGIHKIDVLTLNDRYAVNAINTGFDLEVVQKAAEFKKKPFVSGPLAYILGIVSVFTKKFGKYINIRYTDKDGNEYVFDGEFMLAVAANGAYYGGGFNASPAADVKDGLIDLMIVKKVSRLQFLSLVGAYKKGIHIDKLTGKVNKKFKDIVIFAKCKNVTMSGIKEICADGEIFNESTAHIGILPSKLNLIVGEKEPTLI